MTQNKIPESLIEKAWSDYWYGIMNGPWTDRNFSKLDFYNGANIGYQLAVDEQKKLLDDVVQAFDKIIKQVPVSFKDPAYLIEAKDSLLKLKAQKEGVK